MFIEDLKHERSLLLQIQKHHIQMLYASDNPSGILLFQKQETNYRWLKRDLQDNSPTVAKIHKSNAKLAEKLAINLYRLVCIQYIQGQLASLDHVIKDYQSGAGDTADSMVKKQQSATSNAAAAKETQGYFLAESPLRQLLSEF